ncbi:MULTISPECIES: YihY/virulence factor BrkB family protein [Mycetohabitans]|nr:MULTISPECIES: YihY/virulence factor BrkB family protein [Mycetohabitans]
MAKPTLAARAQSMRSRAMDLLAWVSDPVTYWIKDRCPTMAASIAFYTAFSLAPTLVIVIAVAGFFFGQDAVQGRLFGEIRGVVGDEAAQGVQAIVANAWHADRATHTTMVSILGIVIGASATFSTLNSALNAIWPVPEPDTRASLLSVVRVRLISFGLVLGVAFLIVVLLILDTVISVAGHWFWGPQSASYLIANAVQHVATLGSLWLAFSAMLKFVPDASLQWRDALAGGLAAALLFSGGKNIFAFYLAHVGTANTFGAAGSLAVLLMWLYFSSSVFLLGAEVSATAARRRNDTH